jgi:lipopolysaccharide/colanic/teichoic acid biosynthesis glycosyltransferase
MKRLFDILVSGAGLLFLGPLLLLLALLIKLTSPGTVFYRGERVGLNGRPFRIYKFRSMVTDADKLGASSTPDHDKRVTGIGRFIRKFKLDELPQLINVLMGDMSIVGPRPEVKWCVDMYTEEERAILTVRPGITDWASLKFHNEGEILAASGIADADEAYLKLIRPEKLRLQLAYVREHSLAGDMKIILLTCQQLLFSRLLRGVGRTASAATPGRQEAQR